MSQNDEIFLHDVDKLTVIRDFANHRSPVVDILNGLVIAFFTAKTKNKEKKGILER
jgi:hypothetical protein